MRYSITFFVDKEADKPDGRLRCRIRWQGNALAFLVGYRVNPDKWSQEAQRCTKNSSHGKELIPAHVINTQIEKIENVVHATLALLPLDETIGKEALKRTVEDKAFGKTNNEDSDNILSAFNSFIREQRIRHAWSDSTTKKYKTLYNHIQENWPTVTLSKMPDSFAHDYVDYFTGQGFNNSTTKRLVKSLFTFLRWAEKKGLYKGNAIQTFDSTLKTVRREVIYLTWEELMRFIDFPIPDEKKHLKHIRDVFCFCCVTGLRYSDVSNLKWHDVYDDCIKIVTQKTSEPLKIELNKYSRLILSRYGKADDADTVFHIISEQKANVYLKELARMVGLDYPVKMVKFIGAKRIETIKPKHEFITTHVARRTFVVSALTLGIPAEVVMEWTGHSDYEAMRPYLKIVDEVKKQSMAKFDVAPVSSKSGTENGTIQY